MTEHCNREYAQMPVSDPKSVQELTSFVQINLQQMQDKFQSMSDQIINRNILF
jgi:heat shock factor-binding protein 1